MEWLQTHISDAGISFMSFFSLFGEELPLILIVGFVYWSYDKKLGSLRCRINLIRFHAIPGIDLQSPSMEDMVRFRDKLNDKGIIATIRASRGQDIDAACGLLSTKR